MRAEPDGRCAGADFVQNGARYLACTLDPERSEGPLWLDWCLGRAPSSPAAAGSPGIKKGNAFVTHREYSNWNRAKESCIKDCCVLCADAGCVLSQLAPPGANEERHVHHHCAYERP